MAQRISKFLAETQSETEGEHRESSVLEACGLVSGDARRLGGRALRRDSHLSLCVANC